VNSIWANYTKAQGARQAGIVLNYQNATNYYLIRWGNESDGDLGDIQIVKTVNGSNSQIERITGLNMDGNTPYYDWTFSTSETENEILYSVSAIGSENVSHLLLVGSILMMVGAGLFIAALFPNPLEGRMIIGAVSFSILAIGGLLHRIGGRSAAG
jgi:hypothetical protein